MSTSTCVKCTYVSHSNVFTLYVTLFDVFIRSLWRCSEFSWVISQLPHFMSCVVGTVTSDSDLG